MLAHPQEHEEVELMIQDDMIVEKANEPHDGSDKEGRNYSKFFFFYIFFHSLSLSL